MAHFRGPPAFQGRDDGPSGRHGPQNLGVARASASQPDERRHHASEYRDSRLHGGPFARRGRRAVSRGRGGVRHRPRRCRWPGSSTSHGSSAPTRATRVSRRGTSANGGWCRRSRSPAGKITPGRLPSSFTNGAKLRIYTTARPPRIPYLCSAKVFFVY